MFSNFFNLVTNLAAEFQTRCSLSSSFRGGGIKNAIAGIKLASNGGMDKSFIVSL